MPKYDYVCTDCNEIEEVNKSYSDFGREELHNCGFKMTLKFNMPMLDPGLTPTRSGAGMGALKADEKELSSYFDAIRQGVEPISTKKKDIDAAMAISNETGKAFDGGNPASSLYTQGQ